MNPVELFKSMSYASKLVHKGVLDKIHEKTLLRFRYVTDAVKWGMIEHWETYNQIPDTGVIEGDCDCFAMACRKECRKAGVPSRLVYVHTKVAHKWLGHLVLESNGWVLCNIQHEVVRNNDLKFYEWLKISGYERGEDWSYINPNPELWSRVTEGLDWQKS